ncbi:uncharacterized protein LOC119733859 [Patiria miniata]|uniref:DUF7041 domain-containing protein n=1 Tax=Patiria miniata TaxID=46514 RepID=A0A914AID2_PATMI|nr:uncharacterized protein LOC119733859 [Patiria miniata]
MAESDPPVEPKPVPVELAPAVPVAAVSLKLPPFWPNDPTLWFAQVEAQFLTRHITVQDTKFAYVVSSLQPDIAQEVRDLLVSPPTHDRYNTLKKELIKRTSASEQKRLHQLLIAEELGDRKPSQLLRRMRQLLGENTMEDNILKQLFLQRLPTTIQGILASTSTAVNIEQLADTADKIVEVSVPTVSTVNTHAAAVSSPEPAHTVANFQTLETRINQLTEQVQALTGQLSRQTRQRSRSRDTSNHNRQSRSRRPSRDPTDCWYHWRYGSKARKCVQPCSFKTNPNPQGNAEAGN